MKSIKTLLTSSILLGSVNAIAAEAEAIASWKATAIKDTTSALVVTPLDSLAFDYAAGIGTNGAFNTQKGMFDVTIEGDSSATAFSLVAEKVSGTLTHLSSNSTLDVGVLWNGERLSTSRQVTLIDTAAGINGLNLSSLSNSYNIAGRSSAQESFTFDIEDATTNGTTSVAGDYSLLPDGTWSGDVKVRFIANWQ